MGDEQLFVIIPVMFKTLEGKFKKNKLNIIDCLFFLGYITWEGIVTGFGDSGDLAVDDISITQGQCGGIITTPSVSKISILKFSNEIIMAVYNFLPHAYILQVIS